MTHYIIHPNGQAESRAQAQARYRRAMLRKFIMVDLPPWFKDTPPPSGAAPQEVRV